MTEPDAVASTALATWALVKATWVLAGLTLGVLLVAVFVPQWQRWLDRKDKKEARAKVDREAENAVRGTVELIEEIADELGKKASYDQFSLWPLANRIHTHRRVVEYFFVPGTVSPNIPYRLSACLQALDETADGVQQAIDSNGSGEVTHKAAVRENGAATAKRAVERLANALSRTPKFSETAARKLPRNQPQPSTSQR